jgi:glycosyltransferase involved in cell wall biosynthesis
MAVSRSRPLRVLTLVDGTHGGAESIALQIATHLDRDRFEPLFCVSRHQSPEAFEAAAELLAAAGVPLLRLERRSRTSLRPWASLVSQMRERGVDVVHAHKFGSNAWGALLAPLAGGPVLVAHEHGWSFEGQPLRRFVDRELIGRRADAFVAVSRQDLRRMQEVEGIPEAKLRLIPNGIPTPTPDPAADVRAELGLRPDQPVLGAVATLWPEKALDVLLRAAASLSGDFPGLAVLLAGGEGEAVDGGHSPERRRLAGIAEELGIASRVHFLGRRADVPEVLAALDVAVLCSNSEGSPLAVMEYMEAARPVVATRVGGLPDLVEEGVTGLLVEPQDPAGLAAAIATLLADPQRRAEMGRAGRERRRREFSIEGTVGAIERLYEELHARKAR